MSIERFFTIIKDGAWHNIEALSDQLEIPTSKLTELSKFLYKYGLVKYEEEPHKIQIQPPWNLLLPEKEPV